MAAVRSTSRRPLRSKGPLRFWRTVVGFLAIATLAAIASCSSSSGLSPVERLREATERGPYGVGVTTIELVDTSRPLEPNGDYPGVEERAITVEVWYPADRGAEQPEAGGVALNGDGAPYPLIVFAHGYSSSRRQSLTYTQGLASHGYVVAAPDFPGSSGSAPGGPRLSAALDQPADVSFVIDQLLEFNTTDGHLLEGAIDEDAIGMSGHSLGGLTTLLTAYGPLRDVRTKAALAMSPASCFLPASFAGDDSVPALILGGSSDLITPLATARAAYDAANAPKYFVELAGGNHIRFSDADFDDAAILAAGILDTGNPGFVADAVRLAQGLGGNATACATGGGGDFRAQPLTVERQQELLRAFAVPFFAAYLRGDDDAKEFLQEGLAALLPEAALAFEAE